MPSSSSDAPREQSQPPPPKRVFGLATLGALVTASVFVAYAFLTPAVYRTRAVVAIEPLPGKDPLALEPLEAARQLHEAVLDRELLEKLAKEQAPGGSSQAQIQVGRSIQNGFQIDSVDGRSFTISVRDSDRERAARRCNLFAARAVERGPELLAPEPAGVPGEEERQRHLSALMAFMAAHPELLGDAPPEKVAAPAKTVSDADLRAEREQIQKLLANRNEDSDNPYADRTPSEQVTRLAQRLAQINAKLARAQAPAKPGKAPLSPAVSAEWQRLLGEVTRDRSAEAPPTASPRLSARVVSQAAVPSWPIEPDRRALLGFGALGALAAFALTWLLVRSLRVFSPSGMSSYPPPGGYGSSAPPFAEDAVSDQLLAAAPLALPARTSSIPPAGGPGEPSAAAAVDAGAPRPPPRSPLPLALPSLTQTMALPAPELSRLLAELPERPQRTESNPPPAPMPEPAAAPTPAAAAPVGDVANGEAAPATQRLPANSSSPPRSVRALRAAVEVNAAVSAQSHGSSKPPAARNAVARTTQVLGSPIPPVIAPGSRTPGAGVASLGRSSPPPRNTGTGYSYVRSPPPPAPKASDAPRVSSGPPSSRDWNVVAHPAPVGWRADLSLLPEARRGLVREISPSLPEQCVVIGVFGQTRAADAKSRIAAELALALADNAQIRVLLLEGDLQHPSVQRFMRMGMPEREGLSDQLLARIELNARRPWAVVECTASLHVLAEGLNRAPELVLSRAFEACLREMRAFYDFIVIDGPLLSDIPACRAVHDVMDSAVLVRVEGGSSMELTRVKDLLPGKPISVVPVAH